MTTGEAHLRAGPSKWPAFGRRLASTVLLWTVILTALLSGHPIWSNLVFLLMILALAMGGLHEFYGLMEKRGLKCYRRWGLFMGFLLLGGTFGALSGWLPHWKGAADAQALEDGLIILFVLGLCVWQFLAPAREGSLQAISTTLFGVMYVPWLLNFIQKIHFFPGTDEAGAFYVLYFILVTKFSDSGAYVVGSLAGRHKMVPRISPGKTWEGFGGALGASTAASLLFVHWAPDRLPGLTAGHALALGLMLGAAAVVGDLVESAFKREAGVKDSGRWFPGIGGVLDLLDSLLFNAPLMFLYLRYVVRMD